MTTIVLALFIFLDILIYIIFFDIILSWLTLFGLRWRPSFLAGIIDPMYKGIKKILPTTIGAIDFTPIVVFIVIYFLIGAISVLFPDAATEARSILGN